MHPVVALAAAVDLQGIGHLALAPANIRAECRRRPQDEGGIFGRGGARRERLQDLVRKRGVGTDVLRIHDRARTGDRDRFFERPDVQLCIHCRGEPRGQLDALTPDRREAGQGELHGVGARPQIGNPVLARRVRDDRADLFNERGTGGFHCHAGQHPARDVSHHTRDVAGACCLRALRRRQAHQSGDQDHHTAEGAPLCSGHHRQPRLN